MPIPLTAEALSVVEPPLAQRGLGPLSGVFRHAADRGVEEISQQLRDKTGIDVNDVADSPPTAPQWTLLTPFELQDCELIREAGEL